MNDRTNEQGPIEIGLEGVGFDETLVYYARRCCRRTEAGMGHAGAWRVEIVSAPDRQDVQVGVCVWLGCRHFYEVSAREIDPMLAVRNAFAILDGRLQDAIPPASVITPPAPRAQAAS